MTDLDECKLELVRVLKRSERNQVSLDYLRGFADAANASGAISDREIQHLWRYLDIRRGGWAPEYDAWWERCPIWTDSNA